MRKAALLRLAALEWSKVLQYRGDLVMWMIAETIMPLVSFAIWYAVAASSAQGPTPTQIFTYYIFSLFVVIISQAWSGFFVARDILEGDIVTDLVKPISPLWKQIVNNGVEKVIKLIIPLPILIAAIILSPDAFTPTIFSITHLSLFAISLLLATILNFTFDITAALLAFWLEDAMQLRRYIDLLFSISSGILIPFAFMPEALRSALSFLPFRYIISAPLELLIYPLERSEVIQLLGKQFLWTVALIIIYAILWKRGLKRYAPPGQ